MWMRHVQPNPVPVQQLYELTDSKNLLSLQGPQGHVLIDSDVWKSESPKEALGPEWEECWSLFVKRIGTPASISGDSLACLWAGLPTNNLGRIVELQGTLDKAVRNCCLEENHFTSHNR